ncbi:MAG: hypothetical protein EBW58_12785, partial [Betaproteobacteria bacterium]|nr:hypothetical protein [Betaproteobacteria bacterium]
PDATVVIEGGTDLQPGENSLVVTVTAADGETVATYTVILVVALGDSTELAVFQVNGEDVSDGDVVDLAPYTTEVEVEVETVDPDATVQVEGDSDLVAGLNDLVVTVTAVNGDVRSYVVGLNVVLSDDVSAEVTVADQVVSDGDVVELEYGTDSVVVDVVTVDPEATFVVEGDSFPGEW